jgi:hypothetical protein
MRKDLLMLIGFLLAIILGFSIATFSVVKAFVSSVNSVTTSYDITRE